MDDDHSVQPIDTHERLARFVLFSSWVRKSDQTVKPDAFIPHPYPNLSVTRHLSLSEKALWRVGQEVAKNRPAKMYGRADINVVDAMDLRLEVHPHPVIGNPNHANVVGWPPDKPAQKIIAMELPAAAIFLNHPRLAEG